MEITSLQNSKIKQLLKWQEKSRDRKRDGVVVVEGIQENQLALENGFELLQVFLCEEIEKNELNLPKSDLFYVNREVYEKSAYRATTGGIIGVYKAKIFKLNEISNQKNLLLVVLESVEKPGNLGAVLRTCDAAKVDAVIVCNPLVDFYNPNVVRSSVGTVFTNKLINVSQEELVEFCQENQIEIYSTFLRDDTQNLYDLNLQQSCAFVFGTESTGLNESWVEKSSSTVKIPMQGKVDSLNVSNAVAICIFEAVRQRL